MARITVEDCVDKVPNRFELILVAAQRARTLSRGGAITVEQDNDKPSVVALREIAEQTVSAADMREDLIHSIQKNVEVDEPEALAAPAFSDDGRPMLGRDNPTSDGIIDTMTEEALLRGLRQQIPEQPSIKADAIGMSETGHR